MIGSNEIGKSTLLKCLSGLLPTFGGKIIIENQNNTGLKQRERSRLIAVVPQSFNTDYDFSVEEIVLMGKNPYLGHQDKESAKDYEIVEKAMKMTKTLQFKGHLFNELSGGEKQRVILARAIAHEPDILLLDEPTSALDIHHQIEVMELIKELNTEKGMTIVAVLHDLNLAEHFCKRLIMIHEGRIVADGIPAEVIVQKNLKKLYDMKMFICNNWIFEKLEVIPVWVLKTQQAEKPLRIYVICGGKSASRIIEELDNKGHQITAGVLNKGSDDWFVCKSLNLEVVEERPFTAIMSEKQKENPALMRDADIILIADVPFGRANINNLMGLGMVEADIYMHMGCLNRDFTDGLLEQYLKNIKAHKKIYEIGDYDEFFEFLKQ
ncbi:ABC transporter ATP-binding protein [Eubacterium limosum]|uniref:ABC transporter ATP-binding protein n=1 Tax=Eubacterium limosum TaxID=1736 RepID=A0ABT5UV79_EUBLI|nr:ABC transporter ATP-binding protein [Eubacterium limosum]MDE1472254.1 ABC transporter ATP-binding protein [Eubacterium limosum]